MLTAQITGAILAVNVLRTWLQGDTRRVIPIRPLDRITTIRLFVFEAIALAIVLVVAIRQHHRILGPVAVAVTTFAVGASLGGFGRSNSNPAWALGTATGWNFTTEPRHLVWLIGAPMLSAVIIGAIFRKDRRLSSRDLPASLHSSNA